MSILLSNGITIAGENGLNQPPYPRSIYDDDDQTIYIADWNNHRIVSWECDSKNGQIVAGGNGNVDRFNQLNSPAAIFVDEDYSVCVLDSFNNRVMKDAKQGIIVGGGKGQGNTLTQLSHPHGMIVDQMGHVYVADTWNNRVMRWCKGATEGNIVDNGNNR